MIRLNLNRWNGSFKSPKVMDRIRRKIRRNIEMGRCVLVDLEFVSGLDHDQFQTISSAWPEDKVKVIPGQKFVGWTAIPKPESVFFCPNSPRFKRSRRNS